MARASKPSFVDTGNPALAIECPGCGLLTPRFLRHCRNCGFTLWPSGPFASAAFQAWRDADASRARARRFDLELPVHVPANVFDFDERAHHLGIHLPSGTNYPFVICIGFLFLALAAIPFGTAARIVLAAIGAVAFLIGVIGWVVIDDSRAYPTDTVVSGAHSGGTGSEDVH